MLVNGWIRQLAGLPVRVYCTNVVFEDVFIVLIAFTVNGMGMAFKILSVNFEFLSQKFGQYHLVLFLYMFFNGNMKLSVLCTVLLLLTIYFLSLCS
jgi:hypothetical protein